MTHKFLPQDDPNISIDKLRANQGTLKELKKIITSTSGCLDATDIRVYNIAFDKSQSPVPTYTETTTFQVSADPSINDSARNLRLCTESVKNAGFDKTFISGLKLNVSGKLEGGAIIKTPAAARQSCCHVLYGSSVNTDECCMTGFIEDGNNCGKYTTTIAILWIFRLVFSHLFRNVLLEGCLYKSLDPLYKT